MTTIFDSFPWMTVADRVYGPLADACGLRPARNALETWCELASAQVDETVANAQVMGIMTAGAIDGMNRLTQRLSTLSNEGKTISSPTELLRAGLGELDAALHAAMLSETGLAATAASVRATSRRRSRVNKLTEIGAEAVGQPTRAEVDEAFREIQQLKRELRELKRASARSRTAGRKA